MLANAAQTKAPEAALPLREGFRPVFRRAVTVDGEPAELTRCERIDGRSVGLGGEHFSAVVDRAGRLKGFALMEAALAGGTLPSREDSRSIAMAFLQEAAPDLLQSLELHWIEPHHETIRVDRNGGKEDVILTGMKVKMRNTADGRWFWVIVGPDRDIMVFERDIVWVDFPGHRQTEKWLHDSWLERREAMDRKS